MSMAISNTYLFMAAYLLNFAYVYYLVMWGDRPEKKFYHKLLEPNTFAIHLSATGILAIIGILLGRRYDQLYAMLIAPMAGILLLFTLNWMVKTALGRNMLLRYRGDRNPREFIWYVDGILSIVVIMANVFMPILLMHYFDRFHEVKIGVTNG